MDDRADDIDRLGQARDLFPAPAPAAAQRAGTRGRGLVVVAVIGIVAAWGVAAIVIRDNLRLRAQLDRWTGYAEPGRNAVSHGSR